VIPDDMVLLSLDDFGTGYSSLSFLKRLPVRGLKIDRSFVNGIGADSNDDRIVAGVLGMARALNLYTVAEGIETHAQAERLTDLGCQFGQGYLWSPAVAADQILPTIESIATTDR